MASLIHAVTADIILTSKSGVCPRTTALFSKVHREKKYDMLFCKCTRIPQHSKKKHTMCIMQLYLKQLIKKNKKNCSMYLPRAAWVTSTVCGEMTDSEERSKTTLNGKWVMGQLQDCTVILSVKMVHFHTVTRIFRFCFCWSVLKINLCSD